MDKCLLKVVVIIDIYCRSSDVTEVTAMTDFVTILAWSQFSLYISIKRLTATKKNPFLIQNTSQAFSTLRPSLKMYASVFLDYNQYYVLPS